MTLDQSKTIETMRQQYLDEARYSHRKDDRIAFYKELGEMAVAAGASAWKKFADATSAWVREDLEAALALFEEAIALDPEFAYPWHGKGNVLFGHKRYDEALAAYEKAIALDSEFASPWNGKGSVLYGHKRYDDALAAYEEAIALDPEFASPWNGKGSVLYKKKRHDKAMEAVEKAIEIDPEFDIAHFNLGLLYWWQEKPREAREAFHCATNLGIESPWKEVAESCIVRAERMIEWEKEGKPPEERKRADRSSDEALVTELFVAMEDDLADIREKKIKFKKQIATSVGQSRILGDAGADDMLLVLRDWNSFSPILRREVRDPGGPGPDDRRGGGYMLVWKGHGIVIDPGVDFVTQLYRKGLSIADVDTVILTHCHLDHTRDVESLVDLNYRYNQANGSSPHPRNDDFRQLQFHLCDPAFTRYSEYLKTSGCCREPTQLKRGGSANQITDYIKVRATPAEHMDINGRDDEAIGLVFDLKDEDGSPARVGMTSDSRWIGSLSDSFSECDVVVAHLGTIEVGEETEADAGTDAATGGFLRTDLKDHLGAKGCYRLLQRAKPKIFVVGEFGEELVETRFKIVQVFHRLKPAGTRLVLGGDSNLVIGLGKELSVCCSHPECARSWARIPLDQVRPVLGGDFLFRYTCPRHGIVEEPSG